MKHKFILSKEGYLVNKKMAEMVEINKLKNELTVEPFKFGVTFGAKVQNEFFKVYKEDEKYLYLPKYFGLNKFGIPSKNTETTGEIVNLEFKGGLRQAQQDIIDKVIPTLEEKDGGLISLGCGGGKCLGKDTEILMFDGSIKFVQDIKVGDVIMGDDSTPRNILSITKGKEIMYKVHETKGNGYIVNESHILSLKDETNNVIDISVKDYLKLPPFYHSSESPLRGYRVSVIFPEKKLKIDPYLFGHWLGNKHSHNTQESNIPLQYKCNSRKNQLALLAGIIDSDGFYHHNYYEIIKKNEKLLDDIIYLARSLGFSAFKTINESKNEIYYSTNIYGSGLEEIPVTCLRKKAYSRNQVEDSLNYLIKLEKLKEDDYYGFEIDGNR